MGSAVVSKIVPGGEPSLPITSVTSAKDESHLAVRHRLDIHRASVAHEKAAYHITICVPMARVDQHVDRAWRATELGGGGTVKELPPRSTRRQAS